MFIPSPLRKSPRRTAQPSAPTSSSTLQPPSPTGRSGTTFKDSLRKIPSTIFTRGDRRVHEKKSHDMMNATTSYDRGTTGPETTGTASAPTFEKKVRTKTRKALGELFGWGGSNHANANAGNNVPASPIPPTPPPKPLQSRYAPPTRPSQPVFVPQSAPLNVIPEQPVQPTQDTTLVLPKKTSILNFRSSSKLEKKTSTPALPPPAPVRGPAKLEKRPSQAMLNLRVPSSEVSRASMSDDPFGCATTGAEVVEHVVRTTMQTPSIRSEATAKERRRDSMCSAKALSTKTVASDDFSVQEIAIRARMSSPRRVTMASVIEEKHRLSAQSISTTNTDISESLTDRPSSTCSTDSSQTFGRPQPKPISLGRSLNLPSVVHERPTVISPPSPLRPSRAKTKAPARRAAPAPVPAIAPTPRVLHLPTPVIESRVKGHPLHKGKTKSRIWGFLGKKEKKEEATMSVEPASPVSPVPHRDLELGSITRPVGQRPRASQNLPVFHVSHPSVDDPSILARLVPAPRTAMEADRSLYVESVRTSNRDSEISASSSSTTQDSVVNASLEGPRQVARALAGPKQLPKRKSLKGLFGLEISRTDSNISEEATVNTTEISAIKNWQPPAVRPLSEDTAEITFGSPAPLAPITTSRSIPKADSGLRRVASATDKLISLVTSISFSPCGSPATGGLVNMASFSSLKDQENGTPTPIRRSQSVMLAGQTKFTPPRPASDISPIKLALHTAQIRKMEGIGMTIESPGTPPRSNSMVKKGMRNVFAPPSPEKKLDDRQQTQSNEQPQGGRERPSLTPPTMRRLGQGPNSGLAGFMYEEEEVVGGVPADLFAMLEAAQAYADDDEYDEDDTAEGLPPPPSGSRFMSRRQAPAAPAISLPPVPDFTTQQDEEDVEGLIEDAQVTPTDPRASFDFETQFTQLDKGSNRDSFLAALHRVESYDMLVARPPLPPLPTTLYTIEQSPDSVRNLNVSTRQGQAPHMLDNTRLTPDTFGPEPTRKISPARPRKAPFQGNVAFQQQVSQSKTKASSPITDGPAPELPLPMPPHTDDFTEYQQAAPHRSHRRDESRMSIATMSSIGDVIESAATAREYTNYFEANFAQHLARQRADADAGVDPDLADILQVSQTLAHVRSGGTDSQVAMADHRAPTRRAYHHRRNSSIVSIDSIGNVELQIATGPPNVKFNKHRSGYISKHRINASRDSRDMGVVAWGRTDGASHKRNASTDSNASNTSLARIGRPGLGDRMFQTDESIDLGTIIASPVGRSSPQKIPSWDSNAQSVDSIFGVASPSKTSSDGIMDILSPARTIDSIVDGNKNADYTYDSLVDNPAGDVSYDSIVDKSNTTYNSAVHRPRFDFSARYAEARAISVSNSNATLSPAHRRQGTWDSTDASGPGSKRSSTASDSIFGGAGSDIETGVLQQGFFLKGIRPVSAVSRTGSEQSDAFIDVAKYAKKAGEAIEARGEALDASVNGSIRINSRPRPANHRRHPARLAAYNVYESPPIETPGLSSPSTSESSSRISLETRFSDGQSFFVGHQRQKSSAQVTKQPIIMEEPIASTLRVARPHHRLVNQLSRENLRDQEARIASYADDEEDSTENITSWLRFQREAEDTCRRLKSFYRDSEESRAAVAEFNAKFTPHQVKNFLAQSASAYRPLDSPLKGGNGPTAHRRKASFTETRAQLSPYGLPLPTPSVPCKPRGSLTTKFERSNSAQSRSSLGPSEDGRMSPASISTPTSGLFDGFMPELAQLPAQRRSTPPSSLAFVMTKAQSDFTVPTRAGLANIRKGSSPPSFAGFSYGAPQPSLAATAGSISTPVKARPVTNAALGTESGNNIPPALNLLPQHRAASLGPTSPGALAARQRVDSQERRKALGWGRRRNSDGPEQVVGAQMIGGGMGRGVAPFRQIGNVNTAPQVPVISSRAAAQVLDPSGINASFADAGEAVSYSGAPIKAVSLAAANVPTKSDKVDVLRPAPVPLQPSSSSSVMKSGSKVRLVKVAKDSLGDKENAGIGSRPARPSTQIRTSSRRTGSNRPSAAAQRALRA